MFDSLDISRKHGVHSGIRAEISCRVDREPKLDEITTFKIKSGMDTARGPPAPTSLAHSHKRAISFVLRCEEGRRALRVRPSAASFRSTVRSGVDVVVVGGEG